ncbi:hypothetical protein ACJMK2_036611 [Sinanodonta woodiana]|uniref:ATP-dependent DNA helicase n=1 Tax=Sinanodonta woodiana TaxID=1069815 RepID=A0ABD3WL83_SINWO
MIDIKRMIMHVDTLCIDEISMLSLKLFLQIEKVLRRVRESNFPFGGIQIIVPLDFFQLKPVPKDVYHDRGELIISYEKIRSLIPHHYALSQVHRQTEGDLIKAVHGLSEGVHLSKDTESLLRKLEHPLPPGDQSIKLFVLNYDVEK